MAVTKIDNEKANAEIINALNDRGFVVAADRGGVAFELFGENKKQPLVKAIMMDVTEWRLYRFEGWCVADQADVTNNPSLIAAIVDAMKSIC